VAVHILDGFVPQPGEAFTVLPAGRFVSTFVHWQADSARFVFFYIFEGPIDGLPVGLTLLGYY
jgi:hypothetical protein